MDDMETNNFVLKYTKRINWFHHTIDNYREKIYVKIAKGLPQLRTQIRTTIIHTHNEQIIGDYSPDDEVNLT